MRKFFLGLCLSILFCVGLQACSPASNERGDTSGPTRGPLSDKDDYSAIGKDVPDEENSDSKKKKNSEKSSR